MTHHSIGNTHPARSDRTGFISPAEERHEAATCTASCRTPVLTLLVFALCWLVGAGMLHLLASIKLQAPELLAACPWLTYGRLQPAAWNAFVFGFCVPGGIAVATSVAAQSARAPLLGGGVMTVASVFWNAGLAIGLVGILKGDSTGVQTLELPVYIAPLMFGACAVLTLCPVVSFSPHPGKQPSVVSWYCLGSFFTLPWLYGAGLLGCVLFPLRGVLPSAVQVWFSHGLIVVWGTLTGLGVLFHLLAKGTGTAVPNRPAALFGFWTVVLFGGLGALQRLQGGPFPAWMTASGTAASAMGLLAVGAALVNLVPMLRAPSQTAGHLGTRGTGAAAVVFYSVGMGVGAASAFPAVGRITQFTTLQAAVDGSLMVGFLAITLMGAMREIVPKLVHQPWARPVWIRWQFMLFLTGGVLIVGGLAFGGIMQGLAWHDPKVSAAEAVARHMPYIGARAVGWAVLLGGSVMLAANVYWLLISRWRQAWGPVAADWFRETRRSREVDA